MGLHRYGVTFVHSEEGSRIGGQIVCRVITRAFLSVLLLTVLTCPFIISASYVVWSPIATDVVTDAMTFIEVMPEQARAIGGFTQVSQKSYRLKKDFRDSLQI